MATSSAPRHPVWVRHFRGRTRLIVGAAACLVAYAALGLSGLSAPLRLALSWDFGVAVYLVASWGMMWRSNQEVMERRARALDIGIVEIVGLTVIAAAFSLFAAARVLGTGGTAAPSDMWLHAIAGIGTIVLSWFFVHTLFAIHYAHEFYDRSKDGKGGARGGLSFPGAGHPDYWDFVYFAVVIAMTCQVSDVAIDGRAMRHLVTAHGIVSFFLNTVIVALAVGVAAGLI